MKSSVMSYIRMSLLLSEATIDNAIAPSVELRCHQLGSALISDSIHDLHLSAYALVRDSFPTRRGVRW